MPGRDDTDKISGAEGREPSSARNVALRENRARREWHHARAALCEARGLTLAAEGWRRLCGCNACVPRGDE